MNLDEIIEQHLGGNIALGQRSSSNGFLTQASQGWEPNNLVLVNVASFHSSLETPAQDTFLGCSFSP